MKIVRPVLAVFLFLSLLMCALMDQLKYFQTTKYNFSVHLLMVCLALQMSCVFLLLFCKMKEKKRPTLQIDIRFLIVNGFTALTILVELLRYLAVISSVWIIRTQVLAAGILMIIGRFRKLRRASTRKE